MATITRFHRNPAKVNYKVILGSGREIPCKTFPAARKMAVSYYITVKDLISTYENEENSTLHNVKPNIVVKAFDRELLVKEVGTERPNVDPYYRQQNGETWYVFEEVE